MNIVAKNVAGKLFVAFVAAAMLISIAAPAKAATVEELQAQIAALMAQIAALSGGTAATPSAACTFTRSLTVGSQGADVKCLQDYLTPTYFKNAGGSTGYFGPVTAAAVAAWQSANGVMPAAGYFGPISQAKYTALAAATPTTPGSDDSGSSSTLSGEADLDTADLEDADDTSIEEGAEEAAIGLATLNFVDGDAEVSRLDVKFDGTGNTEARPWKVFKEVSLIVDGEVVATKDADSKSDYSGNDDTLRFTDLKIVGEEDKDLEITIAATIANSVKGAGTAADWVVTIPSIRYFDAEGVATTEALDSGSLDAGDASFSIEEEGNADGAKIKKDSSNPVATTLKVDAGTKDSDKFDISIFNIEVDEDSSDLTLGKAYVDLTFTNNASTTTSVGEVLSGVWLDVDGTSVKGKLDTGSSTAAIATGGATGTVTYSFDFKDYGLDADDTYKAVVTVEFKGQKDGVGYNNDVTIKAYVNGTTWELEGLNDDHVLTGSHTGEEHTLSASTADVSGFAWNTSKAQNGNAGMTTFRFTVSADDEDFLFNKASLIASTSGTATTSAASWSVVAGASNAHLSGSTYTVDEGTSATFEVRWDITGPGSSLITVENVAGQKVPDEKQTSGSQVF